MDGGLNPLQEREYMVIFIMKELTGMLKIRERFSILSILLAGFILGAVFIAGGVFAYKFYFPQTVAAEDGTGDGKQEGSGLNVGPADIAGTVKKVSPAVVNIETFVEREGYTSPFMNDPFFREFFGRDFDVNPYPEKTQGIGTGFIFDKSGLIITNEHVVHGASEIQVTIAGFDKPVKAKVIGSDRELDLAVLKVEVGKDLPTLKLGNSDKLEVGSWVIAIGNPYGLDHTVTVGVISAKGRPVTISDRLYKNLLQTDAAINPGNSGGPLLDTSGKVIGINTAVNASAQGIGFAIPIDTVDEVLDDLVNKGKVIKPYIGVYLQPVDKELADYFGSPDTDGALVSYVVPGGPAEKAGLKRGDIIIEVKNKKVKTPDDVIEAVKNSKIGDSLVLQVFRDKHTEFITVKTVEKP